MDDREGEHVGGAFCGSMQNRRRHSDPYRSLPVIRLLWKGSAYFVPTLFLFKSRLGGTDMCNTAFEITPEDVQTVADQHKVKLSAERAEELLGELDLGAIEKGLLHYCDMDEQTTSAYDDIENHLLKRGVIEGDKVFHSP